MNELISVIVPIYNSEQYLCRCIDSILNQSYNNIELILIDDGSTDRSGLICDEYLKKDNRIKVLHKKNGGLSDARNKGIEIAKGQYIGFVDNDDYIEIDFYETLYKLAKSNNAMVAMLSYNVIKNNKLKARNESNNSYILEREEAIKQLLFDENVQNYVWNKLYANEVINDIRFPVGVNYEDINFMYDVFKKMNRIVCLDSPKYNYYFRENSLVNTNSHTMFIDEFNAVILRFNKVLEDYPTLEKYNAYSLVLWMTRIFSYMVKAEDYNDNFFRQKYNLLAQVYTKYKEYIISKLELEKCIILFLILWDIDRARDVLKVLLETERSERK